MNIRQLFFLIGLLSVNVHLYSINNNPPSTRQIIAGSLATTAVGLLNVAGYAYGDDAGLMVTLGVTAGASCIYAGKQYYQRKISPYFYTPEKAGQYLETAKTLVDDIEIKETRLEELQKKENEAKSSIAALKSEHHEKTNEKYLQHEETVQVIKNKKSALADSIKKMREDLALATSEYTVLDQEENGINDCYEKSLKDDENKFNLTNQVKQNNLKINASERAKVASFVHAKKEKLLATQGKVRSQIEDFLKKNPTSQYKIFLNEMLNSPEKLGMQAYIKSINSILAERGSEPFKLSKKRRLEGTDTQYEQPNKRQRTDPLGDDMETKKKNLSDEQSAVSDVLIVPSESIIDRGVDTNNSVDVEQELPLNPQLKADSSDDESSTKADSSNDATEVIDEDNSQSIDTLDQEDVSEDLSHYEESKSS